MNAVLILNSAAGSINGERGRVSREDLREAFAAAGVQVEIAQPACGDLERALGEARERHPDAVIVGGGDGTLSTAAAALSGSEIPLGVLPLGTLNHFARDLNMPLDWRDAVDALGHGSVRTVDVGEVNGRIFINNCSIGSYPEAVRRRDRLRRERGHGKWRAMALASFEVFRRLRRVRVRIQMADTTLALRTPFVFVGNNRYSGHLLRESLRPRLDEGELALYTTRASRRFTLLRLMWQSLVRSIDDADLLETHYFTSATISSVDGAPLPVAVDGELVPPQSTLTLRTRPGALRVIAPTHAPSAPAGLLRGLALPGR
jgi:diacylglycerol kinase family enzyme